MTAPGCHGQCCSACCACAAPLRLVAAELVRGGWAAEALGLYRQILARHPATATMEPMDLGSIAAQLARRGLVPAARPPGAQTCCGSARPGRRLDTRPGSRADRHRRPAESQERQ
jgi:hypothetical protein